MLNTSVTYRVKFKKKLNLKKPKTLNEKILWLKFNTYWNNSLVKKCADKYEARDYVQSLGLGNLLCKTFGIYSCVDDVDWGNLPASFVLKLNVGCGRNLIVRDSSILNIEETKKKIKGWFKNDAWLGYSEMQYKDVPMVLIMEELLAGENGSLPDDYKFYCMNGHAKYVMVCIGRDHGNHPKFFYYDRNWNLMPFTKDALDNPKFKMKKPEGIDQAFKYAEILSKPFPFVRTDLYLINGKTYFGELTFTPSAGLDNGRLPQTDIALGNELVLPN